MLDAVFIIHGSFSQITCIDKSIVIPTFSNRLSLYS